MSEPTQTKSRQTQNRTLLLVVAWLWVGLPFAYGLYELVLKVVQLFA
jgi:hypothetical protein